MNALMNLYPAYPECIALLGIIFTMLAELFFSESCQKSAWYVALSTMVLLIVTLFFSLQHPTTVLFSGHYISDDLGTVLKLFITIASFFSLYYVKRMVLDQSMPLGDYSLLSLFALLGMYVLASGHSLLSLYLGLELLSLPLYTLTAIRRYDKLGSEASVKYFVMGAIASGMLLYGMSLLYGLTGKLVLSDIANYFGLQGTNHTVMMTFSLIFILVGIAFKLALAPLHMWAPDVYEGAPTPVTLLIASAPKIAAVGLLFRLVILGMLDLAIDWQIVFIAMAVLSIAMGNIVALVQTNVKRLLAYSTISHAGYVLLGVIALSKSGFVASLFYSVIYGLMSTAAFGLLILLSTKDKEMISIDDFKGLNKSHPWLAFLMMITLFSMAGVPPTVGFFTKLLVLKALIDAKIVWLAIYGLAFAVIGAFYYLRIIKNMYFDEAETTHNIEISSGTMFIMSVNALLLLYFGLFPATVLNWCLSSFS